MRLISTPQIAADFMPVTSGYDRLQQRITGKPNESSWLENELRGSASYKGVSYARAGACIFFNNHITRNQ